MGPNNSQIIFNIIVSFVCVGRGGGDGGGPYNSLCI